MPEEAPPRMCVGYCHDSPGHQDRVLALADRLRGDGVGSAEKGLRPVRRRRIGLLAAAGVVAGILLAGPAIADPSPAAAITECDRLAAHPKDPNREGPGVALDKIDVPAAIASCGHALAQNPNNPRVTFNLGRANERAGRLDETVRLFRLAADQGYARAQFNLGVFTSLAAAGWQRTSAKPLASTSSPPTRGCPRRSSDSASSTRMAAAGWRRTSGKPPASTGSRPNRGTPTLRAASASSTGRALAG